MPFSVLGKASAGEKRGCAKTCKSGLAGSAGVSPALLVRSYKQHPFGCADGIGSSILDQAKTNESRPAPALRPKAPPGIAKRQGRPACARWMSAA